MASAAAPTSTSATPNQTSGFVMRAAMRLASQAAEREAGREAGEHGARGKASTGHAEDQRQHAQPERLVDQRADARAEEQHGDDLSAPRSTESTGDFARLADPRRVVIGAADGRGFSALIRIEAGHIGPVFG